MKTWLSGIKTQLQTQLISNTLPHALIFSGVSGAGKLELAQWLTQSLLCKETTHTSQNTPCLQCQSCRLLKSSNHPDHQLVELTGASIGVEQIRTVSRFFEKTAQLGRSQVVIINDAEKMTESAANALLKTLEEPTDNSFIFLLVKDAQRLLPTIISRSYQVKLTPPVGGDLLAHLGQKSDNAFVNLSQISELTHEQTAEQYQALVYCFLQFLMNQQQRMALLTQLNASEHSLRWLEKITVNLMRNHYDWCKIELLSETEQNQLSDLVESKTQALWDIYQLISRANKQSLLLTQLNREYCLEKLLVDIHFSITD